MEMEMEMVQPTTKGKGLEEAEGREGSDLKALALDSALALALAGLVLRDVKLLERKEG